MQDKTRKEKASAAVSLAVLAAFTKTFEQITISMYMLTDFSAEVQT